MEEYAPLLTGGVLKKNYAFAFLQSTNGVIHSEIVRNSIINHLAQIFLLVN